MTATPRWPGPIGREGAAKLAADVLEWDASYAAVNHQENHGGGAFSAWEGVEDAAKDIVRDLQALLASAGYLVHAPPMRHCPPGPEPCEDCAEHLLTVEE